MRGPASLGETVFAGVVAMLLTVALGSTTMLCAFVFANAALDESKRFLDLYYTTDFSREHVAGWTACGSVEQVVEHRLVYRTLGFHEVTLRPTAWDQFGQLRRVIDEVIPRLDAAGR